MYQMRDVCRIVKIKMNSAQYWVRIGIIEADVTGHMPQGKARKFSKKNLIEFAITSELNKQGIEALKVKLVLNAILSEVPDFYEGARSELEAGRELHDLFLIHFGIGFCLRTFLDLQTKGVGKIRIYEAREILPDFVDAVNEHSGISGKLAAITRYYPTARLVNLESIKLAVLQQLHR